MFDRKKKALALAFKVLFAEGAGREPVALLILQKLCSRARHPQNFAFSDFMDIQKLRSCARQFAFFDVWIIYVSSTITLSLETSSKFRRFIFIKIDQNGDHVRSSQKVLIIYLQESRFRSRHPRSFVVVSSSKSIKMALTRGAVRKC